MILRADFFYFVGGCSDESWRRSIESRALNVVKEKDKRVM